MTRQRSIQKIESERKNKQEQLIMIEQKIKVLQDKKKLFFTDLKRLDDEQAKIQESKLLGVIQGIEGISDLSHYQIKEILNQAIQSATPN